MLTEVDAVTLPINLQVSGGALSADGRLVVWSTAERQVLLVSDRRIAVCDKLLRGPVAVAFTGNDDELEIADVNGDIWNVRNHVCTKASTVPNVLVSSAAYSQGFWYFAEVGADSAVTLVAHRKGRTVWRKPSAFSSTGHFQDVNSVGLSASRRGVVVSPMRAPARWRLYSASGIDTVSARGAGDASNAPPEFALLPVSAAIVLPARALDRGFLQVVADSRSDRRYLVLYSNEGAPERIRLINVSLGVLDVRLESRTILALRRTDRLELVQYRWRWQPN